MLDYDIIIIGSGISGLYCGFNLIHKFKKILIIDNRDRLGGRIDTQKIKTSLNTIIYEGGVHRFNLSQKKLVKLLKILDIFKDKEKFSYNRTSLVSNQNINSLFTKMIKRLSKLNKSILIKYNLYNLCKKYISLSFANNIVNNYEKYTMFFDLNGYDALQYFKNNYNETNTFYYLKYGFNSIIDKLALKFRDKGGIILLNNTLLDFSEINGIFTLKIEEKNNTKILKCYNLILTCGKHCLNNFKYLKNIKTEINSITYTPLFKIYGLYPVINGKVWFDKISKLFTGGKLQLMTSKNKKAGLILLSYSSGKYSNYWLNLMNENKLEEQLNIELQKIFPNINIPKPIKIYTHFWYRGVSKWKIGVDSHKIFKKMIQPFKQNLYICGENYSRNQGWMEGSLETSNLVINKILKTNPNKIKLTKTKKNKINMVISNTNSKKKKILYYG